MYSYLFVHMRKILVAQEGWNPVNVSTQLYIDIRYAEGAVFAILRNFIISRKPNIKASMSQLAFESGRRATEVQGKDYRPESLHLY